MSEGTIDQRVAAAQVPRRAGQAPAPRRQRAVHRGQAVLPAPARGPVRREGRARAAVRRRRPSCSSAAASPAWSPAPGSRRPASTTSASSRRAATSAAPGTGTATRVRSATRRRSSTCRCSRRPGTSPPRSTRTRPRSSSTASASARTTTCTTTPCSTPRSPTLEWDDDASRWVIETNRGDRITAPVLWHGHRPAARAQAARHPGHRDVPGPQLPHQPLGLRLHRRRSFRRADGRSWPTSGSPSSAPAPPPCRACRTWPGAARRALRLPAHAVLGRRPRQPPVDPRLVRRDRQRPAGSSSGWRTSRSCRPAAFADEDLVKDGWTDIVQPHPRRGARACRRSSRPRRHVGGLRGCPTSRRWRRSAPASTPSSATPPPPRRSRPGTASCASGPASTTSTCRPTTSPNATWSTPTARASSASPRRGVVAADGEAYEVDCIIYASGFEVGTDYTRRVGLRRDRPRRRDAVRALGRRHAHACTASTCTASRTCSSSQPTQGANLISQRPAQPHRGRPDDRRDRRRTRSSAAPTEVEVTEEAEDAWVDLLLAGPGRGLIGSPDCTPGYYNNEGQDPGRRGLLNASATRGAGGLLPLPRRLAVVGRLRGPRVPELRPGSTRGPAPGPSAATVRTANHTVVIRPQLWTTAVDVACGPRACAGAGTQARGPSVADSFTHLHIHTEYSMLDGAPASTSWWPRPRPTASPRSGITDHGNMYGILRLLPGVQGPGHQARSSAPRPTWPTSTAPSASPPGARSTTPAARARAARSPTTT